MTDPGIEVAVTIAATPAEVWAHLERLEEHVVWMRDARAIRFTGAARRGVGTVLECDTKVGPIALTDVLQVTDWQPGTLLAVDHRGVVGGTGRFVLTATAAGTELRWQEQLRFPWWLGGRLGQQLARPLLAALWRGNLRRLKQLVQSAP